MVSTNETIAEVLKQLTNINQNLSHLGNEKGGLVIHDTFANVSSWVELGITLLATITGAIIGGFITIKLFKKQENLRIKQELRLEFYKGYKKLYKVYIDEITSLKSTLKVAETLFELSESSFKLQILKVPESKGILKSCNHMTTLEKIIKLIKNTNDHIEKINDYINLNKINLSGYKGEMFDLTGLDLFLIKDRICNLERYHREIGKLKSIELIEELIDKHDETVQYTIESIEKIEKIIENSKEIHCKLEYEFLNQYFE